MALKSRHSKIGRHSLLALPLSPTPSERSQLTISAMDSTKILLLFLVFAVVMRFEPMFIEASPIIDDTFGTFVDLFAI